MGRRLGKNEIHTKWLKQIQSAVPIYVGQDISRRINDPKYFLYIGYIEKVPVTMASIQFDDNMTARVDEVETALAHRGNGYARQMTRHLTKVFYDQGGEILYLWPANDTAKRVYLDCGFEVKYNLPGWTAFIE